MTYLYLFLRSIYPIPAIVGPRSAIRLILSWSCARLHPECLCPVPVFTESVGFDWQTCMKRSFEGEDETKDMYVLFEGRNVAQFPVNDLDARLNTVTIRCDAITCRDIAFSDRVDQPFSLFSPPLLPQAVQYHPQPLFHFRKRRV